MTDTAIQVRNLRKSFKNQTILNGIDFTVQKGQVFALLGSNGSGKTTTIKLLTTLLHADSGEMKVCGFDVQQSGGKVRESISLTGQFAAVDDILTGRENLIMMAKLRHIKNPKKEAAQQLEAFGLTDAADKLLSKYSGGMRRRLDLAMSMIGQPQIIFLDEPTTGLDPQSRLSVWNTIRSMRAAGVTVFLTTQYLEEADGLADQIAILHEGKIAAEGSAATLKKLAPPPKLTLTFLEQEEMDRAKELLKDEITQSNGLTLSLSTDGSVKQATDILSRLESWSISATFAQQPPTLEEAFLSIINE